MTGMAVPVVGQPSAAGTVQAQAQNYIKHHRRTCHSHHCSVLDNKNILLSLNSTRYL
jgi:hypothetical protein